MSVQEINIQHNVGTLPAFWDREVIFFANILALFFGNEQETDVLRQEVGVLETYGSRLIPLINLLFQGQQNILILEKEPDPSLLNYFQNTLKLNLPHIETINHNLYIAIKNKNNQYQEKIKAFCQLLQEHPAQWIDGYVTDETLTCLAGRTKKKTVSFPEGSRRGNNKLHLHLYLAENNLPIFDTFIAHSLEDIPEGLNFLKKKGYKMAVIKSAIGASGIGMHKIETHPNEKIDLPKYLFYEDACLVQGWLDESISDIKYIGSPSVQMFISDTSCSLHEITDQILSPDSIHEGNIAPPPYLKANTILRKELLNQATIAGKWLYSQGYRGTASTDFHLIERKGQHELRICEINARVTGATYPSILANHFCPEDAWMLRNIRFSPPIESIQLLSVLKKENLLFYPNRNNGILPFNFNQNDDGLIMKGQFLFLGKTIKETFNLLKQLQELPNIQGEYDRD